MIDISKYLKILNQGLLLDHYSLMCCIRDDAELPKSKRIEGFTNLLKKKGFITTDGKLTEAGLNLVTDDRVVCQKVIVQTKEELSQQNAPKVSYETKGLLKTPTATKDYLVWAHELHAKLQDRIQEKTGKKQVRAVINGVGYSFLPNVNDFSKVLLKAIVLNKLKDFNRIEKCLLTYINTKSKENNWFPLLNYYILKNGSSLMVTDLENIEDDIDNDSTVNI